MALYCLNIGMYKEIAMKVPPNNMILNYDETCLVDNPGAKKVVTRRGN